MKSFEEYTKKIKEEYDEHLMKYDPNSPEATHQIGRDKTWLRFEILTQIDTLNDKRILDFGCGNGLLLDFLRERELKCQYYGWDISERMVEISKTRYPKENFTVCDVLREDVSAYNDFFNYIIVNGVFNLKANAKPGVHEAWLKDILLKLWPLCRGGIATSFLTEYVDWEEKALYYCSVQDIVSFCVKNLSRWFVVRHDYQLWEFTMYVYKEPKVKL